MLLAVVVLVFCLLGAVSAQETTTGKQDELVEQGNRIAQSQKESTASTSKITSAEIMKSSALNTTNTLYGRGLGLTSLQSDGLEYSTNTSFTIRGLGSFYNNSPLVLIDGFERPLNTLAKEDIESITILKDAASLSLYGFRGSNGVLLVKTKTGEIGKTKIEVSYDQAFLQQRRKPQFVDAHTYAKAVNEALTNDGSAIMRYTDNEIAAFKSGAFPDYYPNVNWMNEVLKDNAMSNIYNVSINGGSRVVRYNTIINLQNHDSYMKPENIVSSFSSQYKYSKLNIRTNLDVQLSKTTNFSVKLLGLISETNRPGTLINDIMPRLYNTPAAAFPVNTSTGEWGGSDTWTNNPVAMIAARGYGKANARTLLADWTLTQDLSMLTKGLSAEFSVGFDNSADYWESMSQNYRYMKNTTQLSPAGDALVNPVSTMVGSNTSPVYSSSLGSQWRSFGAFAKIQYDKNWENVKLNSMLMVFHDQYVGNGQFSTSNRQRANIYTHLGIIDKYFIDLSLTGHGSNRLEPGRNMGLFPAISSAWLVSNESFMQDVENIDFLKLRASFGIVGNDYTTANELFKQTYGTGGSYFFTDNYTSTAGMTELRLATTGLTYEKSHKTNVGIEGRFFNLLDVTAEAYYDRRTDILVSTSGTVSSVLGATASMANDGIIDSKGIEIGLNVNNDKGDFSYNVGAMFTYAKSIIVNRNEGFVPYDYLKQTGKPVNQLFGYEAIGFFKDAADIAASPAHLLSTVMPGDIKFKDQNNDNRINEHDRIALGYNTVSPEIYFSVNFNLEYKNVGVDANFQGAANYSAVLNTTSLFWPLRNNTNISEYYYENRWTADNQDAMFPRLSMLQNDNNYNVNSVWVKDRSFLKLRTCELYYKFSKEILAGTFISKAKLYFRGMNLFSLDNLKIVDPEAYGTILPLSASVHLGVNLTF
jgi:TonB-linked SusC/RagA family outer membrane protein